MKSENSDKGKETKVSEATCVLTDSDGNPETVVTGVDGLFDFGNRVVGAYTLIVSAEGFISQESDITVVADEEKEIEVGLSEEKDTDPISDDDNPDTGDTGSDDNPDTGDTGPDDNPDTGDTESVDNPFDGNKGELVDSDEEDVSEGGDDSACSLTLL